MPAACRLIKRVETPGRKTKADRNRVRRLPRHPLTSGPGRYTGSREPDSPPSRARCAQWRVGESTLAYRCGGSTGFRKSGPLDPDFLTCFPFNPADESSTGTRDRVLASAHSRTVSRTKSRHILPAAATAMDRAPQTAVWPPERVVQAAFYWCQTTFKNYR